MHASAGRKELPPQAELATRFFYYMQQQKDPRRKLGAAKH